MLSIPGFSIAARTEQRSLGRNCSMACSSAMASGGAPGVSSSKGVAATGSSEFSRLRISARSTHWNGPSGVPITLKMTLSWSSEAGDSKSSELGESGKQDWPGKSAFRSMAGLSASGSIKRSSAKMHAKDHTSMAVVYRWSKMSSGARYQRVTTCEVIWRVTLGPEPATEPAMLTSDGDR